MPLIITLIGILLLLVLISYFKWNPFVTLIVTSVFVGVTSGMPLLEVVDSIKEGLGSTLGLIAIVLAFGTMIGKMMAESGGAEVIAQALIKRFGLKNVHWAMMFVGFLVGIPVFFQVGFVLLIPLVFTIALKTGMNIMKIGAPLLAGLLTVHGMVPPHPAVMAGVEIYHANVGLTILYAILIGFPTAIIAGPLYTNWLTKRIHPIPPENLAKELVQENSDRALPGLTITLLTVLLPVILMLGQTITEVTLVETNQLRLIFGFLGNPIISLGIAAIFSFFSLGYARGFSKDNILKFTNDCVAPTANILLVIGAGGAFNRVIINSGTGDYIAKLATGADISPILLGFLIALLIRIATGSATVGMMASAGIVAPIVATMPNAPSPELLVLATGAGSLAMAHFNDAGFWMIKEYFNLTVKETLITWTGINTIVGFTAYGFILILSIFV
ncbi:permease DsdX [Bacillus sp. SA1-12]|uniref:GntT/GntP/DsdX family permease n=1 Tax=Bacillus sp. SA1-12 TaxID=1455638 RepID=UPI0006266A0F|nr:gluconate:H+ symporter [Bacillus sp. SA1-12]KKI91836.1 permease DsdX [Bacillus sp. SA1-12]